MHVSYGNRDVRYDLRMGPTPTCSPRFDLDPDLSLAVARDRHAGMCGTRLGRLITSLSNQRVCTDRGAEPAGSGKEEEGLKLTMS